MKLIIYLAAAFVATVIHFYFFDVAQNGELVVGCNSSLEE